MLTMSVFVCTAAVQADAASTVIIKIADVTKKYQEAKSVFDMCNNYRVEQGLSEWELDQDLMDLAVIQATELSFYGSVNSPSGINYLDSTVQQRGKMIGIDVFNNSTIITNALNDYQQRQTIMSSDMNAAGVGVVEVNSKKYICVLVANKVATPVPSSYLTQSNITENQEVEVDPQLLGEARLNHHNNKSFYCGSTNTLKLMLSNPFYSGCYAMIASSDLTTTTTDPSVFTVDGPTFKAVSPGTADLTVKLNAAPAISATVTFKAINKSFARCTISEISDQFYTGSPITPYVSITDSSGSALVLGTDYTVEYSNNINVGVATATVIGKNAYTASTATVNFNIVDDPSAFKIGIRLSDSVMAVGDSNTVTATASNGTSPITYVFDYSAEGSTSFTKIQSGTSSTCSFKPTAAGNYYIRITATDGAGKKSTTGTTVAVNPKFTADLNLSATTLTIGKTVSISVNASGGITPYSYAIEAIIPGSSGWTTLSTSNYIASYKPAKVGSYTIRATVRGNTGKTIEVTKILTVQYPQLNNESTISATSIVIGTRLTMSGAASGGTSPYKYAFYYKKSTSSTWIAIGTEYGSATTANLTPKSEAVYNIKVSVKDNNSTLAEKVFDVTVNGLSDLVNNSYVDPTAVTVKTELVMYGAASKGTSPYKYAYYYKNSTGSSWNVVGTEYGNTRTISFTPKSVGTYDIKISVKDSTGTVVDKTFSVPVSASETLVNESYISTKTVTANNTVVLTGAASSGTAPYRYTYQYKASTGTYWQTIGTASGTATSASFTPKSTGTYYCKVVVTDSNGLSCGKTFTLTVNEGSDLVNNSSISSTTVLSGKAVTLKGAASNGTSPYKYAYYYKRTASTKWVTIGSEYTSSTSATFCTKSSGEFQIKISVKDSTGTVVDKIIILTIVANADLENKSTISSISGAAGVKMQMNGAASGGTTPYTYAYYYKRNTSSSWKVVGTEFGTATSASFKPTSAGVFDIRISVKDSTGTVVSKDFTYTATEASTLLNNSRINSTSFSTGSTITMTGAASGGSTPYRYAYYYKRSTSGTWKAIGTEYSTSTTASLVIRNAGTFNMKVSVKDNTGTIADKTFNVTVS